MELLEPRTLLSGPGDLTEYIKGQLDHLTGGGPYSGSFSPSGSYTLGGVTIDSPSITYTNLADNAGDWSGTLSIGAESASLAVGSLASTIITGFSGSYTLSGSADDAGAFAFTADQFDVGVENVFSASATGVSIDYSPAATGANSKLSIDIKSATGTIIPFHDATVTLGDLAIDDGGFTLADGTLSTGDIEVGGVVEATGPSIVLSNIAEADGSLSGTIALHADSFSLFPGQTAFTSDDRQLPGLLRPLEQHPDPRRHR